jgi:uncharacterized protein (DUF1330 family)
VPRSDIEAFTIAFIGYTTAERAARASEYEDAVLPLLADHGARVLYRGRRVEVADTALPLEVHLLWFPSRAAFEAYLADDRRSDLLSRFGDVFTVKQTVELETIEAVFAD